MNKKPPLLTRTLVILLASMIAANIGGQMYGPLLPLYVQSLGASIGQVGLFFTLSMIAPLLFQDGRMDGWMDGGLDGGRDGGMDGGRKHGSGAVKTFQNRVWRRFKLRRVDLISLLHD